MKKHLLLAAAAALALAPAAVAQQQSPGSGGTAGQQQTQLRPADQNFVEKAAIGNLFEIESSELAEDRAQSAEVKDFAEQMIRDHSKASDELESLAGDLGAKIPSELDAKHQQVMQKLEGATEGAGFDRAYLQAQNQAHQEAISLFSDYSKSGGNQQLTSWASKTLPTLREHKQHLDRVMQQAGPTAQGGGSSSDTGRSAAEPGAPAKQ